MFGAILGDYLGSVFEKIPHKPQRTIPICTDDSYLTCAAIDWMQQIDYKKFVYLSNNYFSFPTDSWNEFEVELSNLAANSLVKWFDIAQNETQDNIGSFSKGFTAWVANQKNIQNNLALSNVKHKGFTNGCLMRNSPIAYLGTINNLSLQQILLLTDIFCKITHPHIDSLNATRTHSTLIHFLLKNILYKENIKQCFTSDDYSLLTISRPIKFSSVNIKPLEFWLKEKENKVFIWDAKTSLNISLSSIYYSKNFLECIDFCNKTEMDTDTYAAIAGPIAQLLWDIPQDIKEKNIEIIAKSQPQIINLLKNSNLV